MSTMRTAASIAATLVLSLAGVSLLTGFGESDRVDSHRDHDRSGFGFDGGVTDAGASFPSECIGTRQIDKDGKSDVCSGIGPAACGRGQYRVDEKGLADACLQPNGALYEAGCAPGFVLQVRAGRDECARTGPPSCPDKTHLRVQKGEDDCVPEGAEEP
jgi:hypothetical protein